MPPERHEFADADSLAAALAVRVGDALKNAIGHAGRAGIAVSGGTTPARFFKALAGVDLDWPRVEVTLVDERLVGEDSPRSNARLVRRHLLAGRAGAARFVPLHVPDDNRHDPLPGAEARLRGMARPFAAVVLGMGTDGHTASWFADGDRLGEAIDAGTRQAVLVMRAASAGEPRITLTLPAVLDTRLLVLHIEGEAKRAALERALQPGPASAMPVRAVLRQSRLPVEVYWSP